MEKIYCYNPDSCSYEELRKPFMMHNFILLVLMLTSFIFFILTCYYHSQNEKTLELVPVIAKNCFSEVENLRLEIKNQRKLLQQVKNHQYMLPGVIIKGESKSIIYYSSHTPLPIQQKNEPVVISK
jgi:hypothetical protein